MFSRELESRLAYIRQNQIRIRQEDALLMDDPDVNASENVYLPASFIGSDRWASAQISDSLAIASQLGNPTFFITMTCNTDWPEIQSQLRPGQNWTDIPMVVVRVFKRKLSLLLRTLKTMFANAGQCVYLVYSIEFQKRGLPHAHILTKYARPCQEPAEIDLVVSAEIPDDPADAILVRRYMMHKHPDADRPMNKYCQRERPATGERYCRFRYPHPLQPTTTIDHDGRVHY